MPARINTNGPAWKIIDLATRLVLAIVITWCVWATKELFAHDHRIRFIEDTRFTDKDGRALYDKVMNAMPPEWLREDVHDIKTALKEMRARMEEIKLEVERLKP